MSCESEYDLSQLERKQIATFQRMLNAGVTEGAVRQRMIRDNVSDKVMAAMSPHFSTSPIALPLANKKRKTLNNYGFSDGEIRLVDKYLRMKKARVPDKAIKNTMQLDTASTHVQNIIFPSGDEDLTPLEKKHAATLRQMIKAQVPEMCVWQKAILDRVSPQVVAFVFPERVPEFLSAIAVQDALNGTVVNEKGFYGSEQRMVDKFERMRRVGVPEHGVLNQMKIDGATDKMYECVFPNEANKKRAVITPAPITAV